jgi:hypothetical protein
MNLLWRTMRQQDNFMDVPVGASLRQGQDGTTRRKSVIVASDGVSVQSQLT